MSGVKSDIEIARVAKMQLIKDVLATIGVPDETFAFSPMGRHIAKLNLEYIDKLKEKYQLIRDQKIRERVESLGVKIQEGDDRGILLQKEKEYTLARQKIETALESFYRSANSLVFQLNKRHITRHMSIFRCIDRRFETGEIFIKFDETSDDEWLLLIYIKNNEI